MTWTRVAARQAGLISREQLIEAPVPSPTIDFWRTRGRLEPTSGAGIYRVAGAPSPPDAPAWFAVLATRSPISYLTAARWWELPVPDDGLIHITRLDRRRLDWPAGVRVHRVGLQPDSVTRRLGMPITTREETLLDCLGWLSLGTARALADRAIQRRWLAPGDVHRRLDEQPGRWGNRQLRLLVGQLADGAAAESERRLHRLLRRAGITGWVPNLTVSIGGRRFEIDIAFAELMIAIEVDGYNYHSGDERFQRDRTKQNALMRARWRILRFTWADIEDRPGYVVAQIRGLLAA